MNTELKIGKTYSIERHDGTIIIFKLKGDNPAMVEIDNKQIEMLTALQGCNMVTIRQVQ